jgi:hypothetical protein
MVFAVKPVSQVSHFDVLLVEQVLQLGTVQVSEPQEPSAWTLNLPLQSVQVVESEQRRQLLIVSLHLLHLVPAR